MAFSMSSRMTFRGELVDAQAHAGAVKGLGVATEHLLGASRAVVPIEEATLERSGVASVDPDSLTGAVSYDTPYAARQHEELTWRYDPGRQAKYLEGPLEGEAEVLQALIATEIRRALR